MGNLPALLGPHIEYHVRAVAGVLLREGGEGHANGTLGPAMPRPAVQIRRFGFGLRSVLRAFAKQQQNQLRLASSDPLFDSRAYAIAHVCPWGCVKTGIRLLHQGLKAPHHNRTP